MVAVVRVVLRVDTLPVDAEEALVVPAAVEEDGFPTVALGPDLDSAGVLVQPALHHRVLLIEIEFEVCGGAHYREVHVRCISAGQVHIL